MVIQNSNSSLIMHTHTHTHSLSLSPSPSPSPSLRALSSARLRSVSDRPMRNHFPNTFFAILHASLFLTYIHFRHEFIVRDKKKL
jgi:hypothetical protein